MSYNLIAGIVGIIILAALFIGRLIMPRDK